MNNRYKFRGKSMETGEWVYGHLIKHGHVDEYYIVYNYTDDIVDKIWVDPSTVGQWTGRTDSLGTDVYEGDRIEDDDNWTYEVMWSEGGCRWIGNNVNPEDWNMNISELSAITVVGNIHAFNTPSVGNLDE